MLCMCVCTYAQHLVPISQSGKWGYADEDGNVIIPAKYSAVGDFCKGYAWVNQGGKAKYAQCPEGGKWGIINKKGEIVCPIEYDWIDYLTGDIIAVNKGGVMSYTKYKDKPNHYIVSGGLWGYYDLANKVELVSPQYNQVSAFYKDGVAWVQKGGDLVFQIRVREEKNAKGKVENLERMFEVFGFYSILRQFERYKASGQWALINKKGELLTDFTFTTVGDFKSGYAWAYNNGYGVLNMSGKTIIPFQYENISECFDGNVFWVWQKDGKGDDDLIGLVNADNKLLTEFKYNRVTDFDDGVAWAKIGEKWAVVSDKGKELSDFIYDKHGKFTNGVAYVSKDNLYGYINSSGNLITNIEYIGAQSRFGLGCPFRFNRNDNDLSIGWVRAVDKKIVWLDSNGKIICESDKTIYGITDTIPNALWDY